MLENGPKHRLTTAKHNKSGTVNILHEVLCANCRVHDEFADVVIYKQNSKTIFIVIGNIKDEAWEIRRIAVRSGNIIITSDRKCHYAHTNTAKRGPIIKGPNLSGDVYKHAVTLQAKDMIN